MKEEEDRMRRPSLQRSSSSRDAVNIKDERVREASLQKTSSTRRHCCGHSSLRYDMPKSLSMRNLKASSSLLLGYESSESEDDESEGWATKVSVAETTEMVDIDPELLGYDPPGASTTCRSSLPSRQKRTSRRLPEREVRRTKSFHARDLTSGSHHKESSPLESSQGSSRKMQRRQTLNAQDMTERQTKVITQQPTEASRTYEHSIVHRVKARRLQRQNSSLSVGGTKRDALRRQASDGDILRRRNQESSTGGTLTARRRNPQRTMSDELVLRRGASARNLQRMPSDYSLKSEKSHARDSLKGRRAERRATMDMLRRSPSEASLVSLDSSHSSLYSAESSVCDDDDDDDDESAVSVPEDSDETKRRKARLASFVAEHRGLKQAPHDVNQVAALPLLAAQKRRSFAIRSKKYVSIAA